MFSLFDTQNSGFMCLDQMMSTLTALFGWRSLTPRTSAHSSARTSAHTSAHTSGRTSTCTSGVRGVSSGVQAD